EVASPGAGVLLEILKQEQEEVAPGEVLGRIGPAQAAAGATSSRQVGTGADSSAVRGTGPRGAAAVAGGAPARQLSPAVRRLLAEHSLDAASVRGTGEGGRITVADVMRKAGESNNLESAASHSVPHSAVRKRIAARMVE